MNSSNNSTSFCQNKPFAMKSVQVDSFTKMAKEIPIVLLQELRHEFYHLLSLFRVILIRLVFGRVAI